VVENVGEERDDGETELLFVNMRLNRQTKKPFGEGHIHR
jgi:hypothetical protein